MSQTYTFLPVVSVTPRDDGRMTISLDWANSYNDPGDNPALAESSAEVTAVCAALDEWVKKMPTSFVAEGPAEMWESYYTSQDVEGVGDAFKVLPTWSVYREFFPGGRDSEAEPVNQQWVSRHEHERAAEAEAWRLYALAHPEENDR